VKLLPAVIVTTATLSYASQQELSRLQTGDVVEKLVCGEDPAYSYALYLPSSYTPETRWPIVYALDARGRAMVPMECFREAAERYGYIVASSYDTRSDGPVGPSENAVHLLWRETHRRFAIDGRRIYMAGFSGMARLASRMADAVPGSVTGVIACGAGFPLDRPPHGRLPFAFFGIAGTTVSTMTRSWSSTERWIRSRLPIVSRRLTADMNGPRPSFAPKRWGGWRSRR
jgi:hypothetical protein